MTSRADIDGSPILDRIRADLESFERSHQRAVQDKDRDTALRLKGAILALRAILDKFTPPEER